MRLLLVGPPGSGKGTQAKRISEHYAIAHISSGELLRDHVRSGTAIGRTVQEYLSRGDLAPDGLVMDVLRRPVEEASRAGGYVLDGFPRTVAQAEAAYLVAKEINAWVQVVLSLEVPHDMLIERMLGRAQSEGRADDNPDVIRHRIDLYEEVTPALLEYYERREIVIRVDGSKAVDDVTQAIISELERVRPKLN